MRGKLRINEMFAYVVVDDDGTEGVPSFPGPGGMQLPMMGADTARAESLKPIAQAFADHLGKPITLLRFTVREEVHVVRPRQGRGG